MRKDDRHPNPHTEDFRGPNGRPPADWWPEPIFALVACDNQECVAYGDYEEVACYTNADGIVRLQCGECLMYHDDFALRLPDAKDKNVHHLPRE